MFKDFKEFALRGNVIDLAVGVIIGAAFGKIVSSLVADVIMPPIGLVLGGVDFSNLFVDLGPGEVATLEAAKEAGVPTLNYGLFLESVVDFVIVAFVIFMVVKAMNALARRRDQAAPEATTKDCP